jgi:hypothetical protein
MGRRRFDSEEEGGLESHDVFLTDDEALFIIEARDPEVLDRLVGDVIAGAAGAWKDLAAGPPRTAPSAYSWRRAEPEENVSFAPTPGPGDSDGGDVFAP